MDFESEIISRTGKYPLEISIFLQQLKNFENETEPRQKIIDKAVKYYRFYRSIDIDQSHNKFIRENLNTEKKRQQFLLHIYKMDRDMQIEEFKPETIDHNLCVFDFKELKLSSISPLAKDYLLTLYPIQSLSLTSKKKMIKSLKNLIHMKNREGIPKGYDFEYYFRFAITYQIGDVKKLSFSFLQWNSKTNKTDSIKFEEKFKKTAGVINWNDIVYFFKYKFKENTVIFCDTTNFKFIDGAFITLKDKKVDVYFFSCSIDQTKDFINLRNKIWDSEKFREIKDYFEKSRFVVNFNFVAVVPFAENFKKINDSGILVIESKTNEDLFRNLDFPMD